MNRALVLRSKQKIYWVCTGYVGHAGVRLALRVVAVPLGRNVHIDRGAVNGRQVGFPPVGNRDRLLLAASGKEVCGAVHHLCAGRA